VNEQEESIKVSNLEKQSRWRFAGAETEEPGPSKAKGKKERPGVHEYSCSGGRQPRSQQDSPIFWERKYVVDHLEKNEEETLKGKRRKGGN